MACLDQHVDGVQQSLVATYGCEFHIFLASKDCRKVRLPALVLRHLIKSTGFRCTSRESS
ncbi:hypothetical protein L531_0125 [Bordetella bronchiseptica MO275]|nr:hypothetical protein L530_0127 [Bordetella bronchiseptica MO211]KDD91023.1 hypothetical protein L531_0125 [Bordetella bronchiseptica MO275]